MNVALVVVTILSLGFAGRCYLELYRWAKQCQRARIAIAHNRRVQIQAPLTEWLGWANALTDDDASRGRMIYRNGKVSVSILRPREVGRVHTAILRLRRRRKTKAAPGPAGGLRSVTNASGLGQARQKQEEERRGAAVR